MQTYKTAATARRGAFRQKLNPAEFTIEQDAAGLWIIVQSAPVQVEPNSAPVAERAAMSQPSKAAKATRATKPKRQRISTVANPVAFVWAYLNDHPTLSRKDAIAALVEQGCAPNMVSTQRWRWTHASAAERKTRAARAVQS